ncbi:MAG: hypothetical protein RLZZ293_1397 [Pseudomonadota bacterium]|jgi:H+/gluconate symporter-like permease
MLFYFQLASLSIIILYTILVFRNIDPLIATIIAVGLGFLFNWSTPIEIGKIIANSLGSFLALVGLIIMLGRGLGEVLTETKVSHTLVHKIVHSIGVNTQTRVKVGVIISSLTIVAILGTLAGGLAILAPILRPIASKVKLSRPSLAVLMQASGEEALILGPFAPPVVALLGVSGLSYTNMLIYASIPISCVTLIVTWYMAGKLQQQYANEQFNYDQSNTVEFIPNSQQKKTTLWFIISFVLCVVYGLLAKAGTSFVIFVMLFLTISSGLSAKLSLARIFELLLDGMKKNFHLFFIFLLLGPMLDLVQQAGGFNALLKLFAQLNQHGGKTILAILVGITGAFGMPAAAAAVIKMLYSLFIPSVQALNLSMTSFAFSILLATRITNFAIPGANMFAAMGFAESSNIKAMIKNGLIVTIVQIAFLVIYSISFS